MLDDLILALEKSRGRVLSKQSVIPTIVNDKSVDEDLTKDFNKFKIKARTVDLDKTPLFAKTLHKTGSIYTQAKENDKDTTWNENAKHGNVFGKPPSQSLSPWRTHIRYLSF